MRNRQPGPAQFHKAITAAKALPEHSRRQSKQWLIAHGYHALHDGDLWMPYLIWSHERRAWLKKTAATLPPRTRRESLALKKLYR